MNDNTTALLEKLADKLGTTSEMLWGVLVEQAPISATVQLICFVTGILVLVVALQVGIRLWKHGSDVGVFITISASVVLFMLCAQLAYRAEIIMAGFLNPEYWALNRILDTLEQ